MLLSWSGGKDSAMALQALIEDPGYEVAGLLTTVAEGDRKVSHHGVPEELIRDQVRALGLPLDVVYLPTEGDRMLPNEEYEAILAGALRAWLGRDVGTVAHGDLFLEDIREYRERVLGRLGMRPVFPIWGRDTTDLVQDFLRRGFRAVVSSVDATVSGLDDPDLAGRCLDEGFLAEMAERAPGVDPAGENGEYHSFVWDGPPFRRPVEIEIGDRIRRGDRWYAELGTASTREGVS